MSYKDFKFAGEPSAYPNTQNHRMHPPVGESFQQSVYIAALDRYFGINGVMSSVVDIQGGKSYTFDFYAPQRSHFIKIFKDLDHEEIERYGNHPNVDGILFVLDVSGVVEMENPHRGILHDSLPEIVISAVAKLGACLFVQNRMWDLVMYPGDVAIWEPIMAIEYQKGFVQGAETISKTMEWARNADKTAINRKRLQTR